jgi:hypothetical protein
VANLVRGIRVGDKRFSFASEVNNPSLKKGAATL